jgi:hypothetical protein
MQNESILVDQRTRVPGCSFAAERIDQYQKVGMAPVNFRRAKLKGAADHLWGLETLAGC